MIGLAKAKARLFIISAPSGSGKTTLLRKLVAEKSLKLAHSVSMTTRPPRPGERDGKDYHFISEREFKGSIKKNAFLEYEDNFGYFYGTPKSFIEKNLKKGRSVLLAIDVKGAMKVRAAYPEESVFVFILPPSLDALKKRLKKRMSDDGPAIRTRLALAKKEMSYKDRYDYVIVNDRIDRAFRRLEGIVTQQIKGRVSG